MMRIVVILYFLYVGLRDLWAQFSSIGVPQSLGEILSSKNMLAAFLIVTAVGLFKYKDWARKSALGYSVFLLLTQLPQLFLAPQALLLGMIFLAPILGASMMSTGVLLGIGFILLVLLPALIFYTFSKASVAQYFTGISEEEKLPYFFRFRIQKDWWLFIAAFAIFGISQFDQFAPRSLKATRENKEFKAAVRDFANSDLVKNQIRRDEVQKKNDLETRFALKNGFFSKDLTKLYFETTTGQFDQLNLVDGKVSRIRSATGLMPEHSVDLRYILESGQQSVFDLEKKADVRTIFLGNLNKKQSAIGFGPQPETYLLFEIPTKSWVLRNIFDEKEIWRLQDPQITDENFQGLWFPPRKIVFIRPYSGRGGFLIDAVAGAYLKIDNDFGYNEYFLPDEDEAGFVYMGKSATGASNPFLYDLRLGQRQSLPLDGKPILFSMKDDLLLTTQLGVERFLELHHPARDPANAWREKIDFSDVVHPNHSKFVLSVKGAQLNLLNTQSHEQKPIGAVMENPVQQGLFLASPNGDLVAFSSHRSLQVLWRSEFEKEIPKYFMTKVIDE